MNIIKEDIILRAIELEDADLLKNLINDPEIEKMVVGWSFPVSTEQQIKWINNLSDEKNNVRFIIDIEQVGAVGVVSLTGIDFKNRVATINIKLKRDSKIQNKGIGYKAVTILVDYAFNQLNLNCIVANILSYNIASQKLFEKCGFQLDGKLRHRVFKNGSYHDLLSYSLLKSEYK